MITVGGAGVGGLRSTLLGLMVMDDVSLEIVKVDLVFLDSVDVPFGDCDSREADGKEIVTEMVEDADD